MGNVPNGLNVICNDESERMNILVKTDQRIKDVGFVFNELYSISDSDSLKVFITIYSKLRDDGFFLDTQMAKDFPASEGDISYYLKGTQSVAINVNLDKKTINFSLGYR